MWPSKDKVRTKRGVVSIFQRTLGTPDIHQRWMGREGSSGRRRRNRRRVSFFFFTPTSRFFSFLFFNVRSSLPDPTQFVFFVSNQFTRPSPHNHNDDGRRSSSSGSSNKMPVHFSTGLILAEGRKKKRRFFF